MKTVVTVTVVCEDGTTNCGSRIVQYGETSNETIPLAKQDCIDNYESEEGSITVAHRFFVQVVTYPDLKPIEDVISATVGEAPSDGPIFASISG